MIIGSERWEVTGGCTRMAHFSLSFSHEKREEKSRRAHPYRRLTKRTSRKVTSGSLLSSQVLLVHDWSSPFSSALRAEEKRGPIMDSQLLATLPTGTYKKWSR